MQITTLFNLPYCMYCCLGFWTVKNFKLTSSKSYRTVSRVLLVVYQFVRYLSKDLSLKFKDEKTCRTFFENRNRNINRKRSKWLDTATNVFKGFL